tara:strand:- start:872 stop:1351 length:480 start_codon:yes stop_codon:yes gene_type:complete
MPFLEKGDALFQGHKPLHEVERLTKPLSIPQPKNAVAVIRNPVDRIISCINYFKTYDFSDHKYAAIEDVNELSYLLMDNSVEEDEMFPFLPQVNYLKGSLPIKFFSFERLHDVFSFLDIEVRHDNKSRSFFSRDSLSDTTIRKIKKHYKDDFLLYSSIN